MAGSPCVERARAVLAAGVVALAVALPDAAHALPRFAARTGAPCSVCHVNPTGAGMRTAFARNVFERHQLPMFGAGDAVDPRWFSSEITDSLALGFDLRWDYLWEPSNGGGSTLNSFFLMQGDLYLAAELGRRATLYLDAGIHGNFEVFGLLHAPEWANAYLKLGAFVPPYGLKIANHRAYVRALTIGEPPADRDAGLELGIYPGPFSLHVAVFNGGFDIRTPSDSEPEKGISGRVDARLRAGPLRLTLGGSALYNDQEDTRTVKLGPYVMASLGRFTYLGELAYSETQDTSVAPVFRDTIAQLVTYHELVILIVRGLDVFATLETADLDLQSEPNQVTRVGIGFEWFPWPLVEIDFQYRRYFADDAFVLGSGERVNGDQDLAVLLHLFF